jgi:hypothetical protein
MIKVYKDGGFDVQLGKTNITSSCRWRFFNIRCGRFNLYADGVYIDVVYPPIGLYISAYSSQYYGVNDFEAKLYIFGKKIVDNID